MRRSQIAVRANNPSTATCLITEKIVDNLFHQKNYSRSTADSELMLAVVADIDVITHQTRRAMSHYEKGLKAIKKKLHSREREWREFMSLFSSYSDDIFNTNVSGNFSSSTLNISTDFLLR